MRRWWVALVVTTMVARPTPSQAQPATDWGTFKWERSTGITSGIVAGAIDSVFKVLPGLMKELGVEMKEIDRPGGTLAARRYRVVRKLGKDRVSLSLSCGDSLTGANADSYYVYITAAIQLSPLPNSRTNLSMFFGAEAINVPGGQNERVACATTGNFEQRVVTRLTELFPPTS
jgi:hypothetical protein